MTRVSPEGYAWWRVLPAQPSEMHDGENTTIAVTQSGLIPGTSPWYTEYGRVRAIFMERRMEEFLTAACPT